MNKLDKLIAKLCPDGVEYKPLGDLVDDGSFKMTRGNVISKKDIAECPGEYPIYSSSSIGDGEFGRYGKFMFDEELVTWSIDGGGKFFYRPKAKYSVTNVCGYIRNNVPDRICTKFLYYALSTQWACKSYDYTHKALPSNIVKDYVVPLPPLAVQEEIVRMLDGMTGLISELEQELAARKQQYEWYRDKLLKMTNGGYKKITIGEIAQISRGKVMSKIYLRDHAGVYPVYSSQTANDGEFGRIDSFDFDGEYLTWTTDGANAGFVFYRNGKFSITNVCGLIKVTDVDVDTRYLGYVLRDTTKDYVSPGMGNAKLMSNVMASIAVNIPPLAEQKKIVARLESFDKLCNSMTDGLPGEIALRKQQYEFYRDQLLTFKKAG